MPRISRKIKRRKRPTEYEPKHVQQLLRGSDWFHNAFGVDVEVTRIAWESLRDELMPQWIAERPGTRPHAWWRFDAPGRRERTDGVHPFDRSNFPEHLKKLSFGKPSCHPDRDSASAEYESEADFLRRHGLLKPEEM